MLSVLPPGDEILGKCFLASVLFWAFYFFFFKVSMGYFYNEKGKMYSRWWLLRVKPTSNDFCPSLPSHLLLAKASQRAGGRVIKASSQ
jgi:hypothetical protein